MDAAANYIGGEWVGGSQGAQSINPSNTRDVVGVFARGSGEDVKRAVAAAKQAFTQWSRSGIQQRHVLL